MVQVGFPGTAEGLVLRLQPYNFLHALLLACPGGFVQVNEFTQDSVLYISVFDKRKGMQNFAMSGLQ